MADTKISDLTELTAVAPIDLLAIVDDPDGSPVTKNVTVENLLGILAPQLALGRLTLTSGTPVTTADVSGATTLYYTPYVGDKLMLYDGSKWDIETFTEISLPMTGFTASSPYDIFAFSTGSSVGLESLIWTDGTNRATALAYQDGVLIKSGDETRRYLGTIYINSSGGQTEDTEIQRFVWNYYNRISKSLHVSSGTGHSYGVATWRPWNNDANLRVEIVLGLNEEVSTLVTSFGLTALVDTDDPRVSIGYDSTNSNLDSMITALSQSAQTVRYGTSFIHKTEIGYHYYQIIEISNKGTPQFDEAHLSILAFM